jgi:type I restriction enzyme S subunit
MSKRNENRQGYKKTKVGWIPSDWVPVKLGSCFKLSSGETKPSNISEFPNSQNNIPVYGGNGIMGYTNRVFGDCKCIVIGRVGENCGCVYLVNWQYFITDNALYTKSWQRVSSIEYFAYYLDYFKLSRLRNKGGQPLVSQKPICAVIIPLPPLPEQKKIAEILSAWDRAIGQVNELIESKERLKKGLMQQLLTGRIRFPKFGKPVREKGDLLEGWEACKLGACFKERKETNPDLPLLAITSDRGVIPREEVDRKDTSNADKSKYKRIVVGDIGYNTMRMWQGVSAVSSLEGIVSPAYTICTPKKGYSSKYFGYLFKYPPMIHLLYRFSQGLVSDTLSLKFHPFSQIKVRVPSEAEQIHIVETLSSCDQEIELLCKKEIVLREQKKGLMQKLLTGEIRHPDFVKE